MIVRFKANKKTKTNTNWLTQDKFYVVLGLQFSCEEGNPKFCIKSEDNNTPILIDSDEFEIVNSNIRDNWEFTSHQNGFFSLRPKEFAGSFWDDFHDADPLAEEIFWRVYRELEKELISYL